MYRAIFAAALCSSLASCAGKAIDEGMKPMVGQPLSAAVAKLGIPTEERMIAGQKVYIWSSRSLYDGTELKCEIRVMMAGEVIGAFDFEGNEARCMRYAGKLRS